MPNDSRSRRDKKEKERKRKDKKDPKPLHKELSVEEAEATFIDADGIHSEEALAFSVSLLGAKPSSKAMENSLSAFAFLSSAAEGKDSTEEKKSNSLSQGDSEDGGTLSDGCEEVTPISRQAPLTKPVCGNADEAIRKQGEAVRNSGNRISSKVELYLSSSFSPCCTGRNGK
jgi:hypothetical protein